MLFTLEKLEPVNFCHVCFKKKIIDNHNTCRSIFCRSTNQLSNYLFQLCKMSDIRFHDEPVMRSNYRL